MDHKNNLRPAFHRPGGFEITEKMLAAAARYAQPVFDGEISVLDIGCGEGGTLRRLKEMHSSWKLTGVEPALRTDAYGKKKEYRGELPGNRNEDNEILFLKGTAEKLPAEDNSTDLVILECVYTRIADPAGAIAEIKRVLRPDGKIMLSDLYSRAEERTESRTSDNAENEPAHIASSSEGQTLMEDAPSCQIGRLPTAAEYIKEFRENGLSVLEMQDVSDVIPGYVGQLIFDEGKNGLEDTLGMSLEYLKARKCGYFYMLAEPSGLEETVGYAAENSTFYREKYSDHTDEEQSRFAGLPAAYKQQFQFTGLPFTTPEEVKADPESLLCVSPKEIARVITIKSSGSTGIKKRLFFTAEDLKKTADFFSRGIRFLVKPGYRVAVFMEGRTHFSVGGLLKEGLARLPAQTDVYGFINDYEEAAAQAENADTFIGIPSQMFRLASIHPELRPKTVLLSGDYVPESVIRSIEKAWETKVFTHWGMTETGYGGGVQCEARGSYHLRDDDLYLEIIDPETGTLLPDGEYGEIVVSTPGRRGMPLLRYRTGDLGAVDSAPCPCGCLKPRLKKVMGRTGDSVRLKGGERISIEMLDEWIYGTPGLTDYSASFSEKEQILELIVKKEERTNEYAVISLVRDSLKACLMHPPEIRIRFGDFPVSTGTVKRRLEIK